jgi:hypothetical protein
MAERMGMGWTTHGEENWKRGGPDFFAETRNHLEYHWLRYRSGDKTDDHLAATATNAMMLLWWERAGKAAWEAKELARCEAEIDRANREGSALGAADWAAEQRLITRNW